jgi:ankyrin repeat protein
VVGGSPSGSLLQHAAWVGDPELVRRLIALGAAADAGSDSDDDTPLAWAAHGSQYYGLDGRDYVAVAELLEAAGNTADPRYLDVADGPLLEWLEQRVGEA